MGLSSLSLALLYSHSSRIFSFTPPQFSLKWMFRKTHRFWPKIQTWSDSFWLLSIFDFQTSPLFFVLFCFAVRDGTKPNIHFVDHNKESKKYYHSNAVHAFECRPSWFKACTHRATSVPSEAIYQNSKNQASVGNLSFTTSVSNVINLQKRVIFPNLQCAPVRT